MIFNKKHIKMLLLVAVITQLEAMGPRINFITKRKPEKELEESSARGPKRRHVFGEMQNRFNFGMERASRQKEIEDAIEKRDFTATKRLLSLSQAEDIDQSIINNIFDTDNFKENKQIELYKQLKKINVPVLSYVDAASGKTIFHLVAENNHSKLFYNMLLDSANPKRDMQVTDDNGNTILHVTTDPAIARDVCRIVPDIINAQDKVGNTPLHLVTHKDLQEYAATLLALGASLDILNQGQENAYQHGVITDGIRNTNPLLKDPQAMERMTFMVGGLSNRSMPQQLFDRAVTGKRIEGNPFEYGAIEFSENESDVSDSNEDSGTSIEED